MQHFRTQNLPALSSNSLHLSTFSEGLKLDILSVCVHFLCVVGKLAGPPPPPSPHTNKPFFYLQLGNFIIQIYYTAVRRVLTIVQLLKCGIRPPAPSECQSTALQ